MKKEADSRKIDFHVNGKKNNDINNSNNNIWKWIS